MSRVLVNAVAARRGAGAAALAPYVVAMADSAVDLQLDVYVTKDFTDRTVHPRIRWIEIDIPQGFSPRRFLWDYVRLAWRSRAYDGLLSPLNFGPIFSRHPHVLLARNILYFEPDALGDQPLSARLSLRLYKYLSILSMNAADAVVVPSETMATAVRPYLRRKSKLVVQHEGVDISDGQHAEPARLPERAAKWASADMRLLHVSSPALHKDLVCVARTLGAVASSDIGRRVALAVTFDEESSSPAVVEFVRELAELGVKDAVAFLGPVSRPTAFGLYAAAHVTLMPSKFESFGRPVLESLSVGTPVVASDIPSLCEVGGGFSRHHPVGDWAAAAALTIEAAQAPFDPAERERIGGWLDGFTVESEAATALKLLGEGPRTLPRAPARGQPPIRHGQPS